MRIAIVGAGAAGCFCAINIKREHPDAQVDVYEAAGHPLAKVAVTGGGRCNLTNTFAEVTDLKEVYPRGNNLMKRLFRIFGPEQTREWFEESGVALVAQEDQCIFPRSQDAMEIVDCLTGQMRRLGVGLHLGHRLTSLMGKKGDYLLTFRGDKDPVVADMVVVTTGGSPRAEGLGFLSDLDVPIVQPVPSLFALRVEDEALNALSGVVATDAQVSLAGTKIKASGDMLITHFGVSGPAVLRLSSYAARHLAECGCKATLCVGWMGNMSEADVTATLKKMMKDNAQKMMQNVRPDGLTQRLWMHILNRANIAADMRCNALPSKSFNKLLSTLTADTYPIAGADRHREEFVTCGGVALTSINTQNLESKKNPGLFFAGEVLDVDGVTGGFNLQAAWTMGMVVAKSVSSLQE